MTDSPVPPRGAPPLVVAELGANHDGSVEEAHALVDMCADAGAHAVKLQTYTADELLVDQDREISWGPAGRERRERVGPMFDRLAFPRAAHAEIFAHARERGLLAFSTPFSVSGVEHLADLGVPLLKIASSDVTHGVLLDAAAAVGVPVVLSTGKATLGEVDAAVGRLVAADVVELVLLHCVAAYPAPPEDMNLQLVTTLRTLYPHAAVGLSDHTVGTTAAVVATALGAQMVEKHVTRDRTAEGPDHWFSADGTDLAALVRSTREAVEMRGDGVKRVTASEQAERRSSVRSLVLRRAVTADVALVDDDLDALRPGTGISPLDREKVVGRRLAAPAPRGTVLTWDLLR